jgi:hypothetical protein
MTSRLRENFLMADRDPVTEETLASMIRRSFATCDFDDSESAEIIQHLVEAHYAYRLAAAAAKDDDLDLDAGTTLVPEVQGDKAEQCYFDAYIAAYKTEGAHEDYARESAWWPEALPLQAPWDPELLAELAKFQVGHELVSMDYTRALIQREQLNGSAQS